MEAYCDPLIDYSNISEIIKKQKDSIRGMIDKYLKVKTKRSFAELEKNMKSLKKVRKNDYK
jgi:hypothetical protein